MRRLDLILICLGFFLGGGLCYLGLQALGVESLQAGIWTQGVLVLVVIGWITTYLVRVGSNSMTYHQQIRDYDEAMIRRQWDSLSSEERERLQNEVIAERDRDPA